MAKSMPEDVKQVCLWIARGHERRVLDEKSKQRSGTKEDRRKEWERIRAVDMAMESVGADIEAEEVRDMLRKAMELNVRNGREYPYEILGLDAVSRADFYRRKEKFLREIAERLGLL